MQREDMKSLVWFKNDLRVADNPAFATACSQGDIIPVFILDDNEEIGSASKVWLHYALNDLSKSLANNLIIAKGNPEDILLELAAKYNVDNIYWNRTYTPYAQTRDSQIKKNLSDKYNIESFNGSYLYEPSQVLKADKTPYKVFTPFFKKGCLPILVRGCYEVPQNINYLPHKEDTLVNSLRLLPNIGWDKDLVKDWNISEAGGLAVLNNFMDNKLDAYSEQRDFMIKQANSNLAPYMHFGQVSPYQVYHAIKEDSVSFERFLSQLCWREFSSYLMYHFNQQGKLLYKDNWNSKFNSFKWDNNPQYLIAWQTGKTGIPIIDAGMRELYQTGYMHNRVRMIVASFLTKNLLIDWRFGLAWFDDCLFDADLANNAASWQWVAGCGADAAPYFRIFNPVTQSEKFDSNAEYIRKYVPELANMNNKYIHNPSKAPEAELLKAGIRLGVDYPIAIVDLAKTREKALERYKLIK